MKNPNQMSERELRAEVKSHRPKNIKSAPKDGTEILGWRVDCGWLIVRWDCAESFLTESEIEAGDWNDNDLFLDDWFCADFVSGSRLEGSEAPTHWMKLPDASL